MTLIERLFDYIDKIQTGKIKTGRKHRWAVERFSNDIDKLENDSSPFYFDKDELENFYEWAKMFKHKEGILANQPIELTDFQLFVAANILCWKRNSDGKRRFRKAFIQLARKNAKTQFLALLSTYISFLSNEKEQCYIAGWSREQSSICYDEILTQLNDCDLLEGKFSDSYGKVKHHKTGSIIQPLSREARKTGDGKNPSVAIIDEYHAHETSEIYDVMVSGMAARTNPLITVITTAGFDLTSPCYTEYEYVSKVIDPDQDEENDEYFVLICELDPEDDINDESNWIKANPIVATYESGLEYLRSELKVALAVPEKMRSFLTKNMNRWVDQKENGYMALKKWDALKEAFGDLSGSRVYLGVDLSATEDLTSIAAVIPKDGKYYVKGRSFIPSDRLKEKMMTDKQPYDTWIDQGYLIPTDGEIINYHDVENSILDLIDYFKPSYTEVDYDKWNAAHLAQSLENQGVEVVEIPQRIAYLSTPTKRFREEVYSGNVIHEGDPVLRWAISNAILKIDDQENIMVSKKVSKDRIDPLASVLNAFSRAMHDEHSVNLNDYIMSDDFSL
ncbi:terminase large subunit [Alkalibacillus almallahensis]|uniref:terminase large subunit n=1 Tax=Alkalibacillus almallahensis TaxID=1379154 RepID=UPI001421A031|nr:terminase TerL endonuclease subunit [Alkalibacillus almallahensis]NIK10915.1 phage terminase large subunit-like protein [Alkalibacillus almallahensis]